MDQREDKFENGYNCAFVECAYCASCKKNVFDILCLAA